MYRSELLYEWARQSIKNEEVWPVFVPSYNRPNASLLKRVFTEPEFPLILCIRREQKDLYKVYEGKCGIMLLDNVNDLSETREAIVQEASKYFNNIFMMDDDISWLDYMIPSYTRNGKESMRASRTCYGKPPRGIEILKMWMSLIMNDRHKEKIALSSVGYRPDNWQIANKDKENKYNSGVISQCWHMNLALIKKNNIHYRPMRLVGVEDYSFQFDVMTSGLYTTVYKDLMYDCPAINSTPGGCENAHGLPPKERYEMYLNAQKLYYGNHPGVKFVKTKRTGFETMKFNWDYWRKL